MIRLFVRILLLFLSVVLSAACQQLTADTSRQAEAKSEKQMETEYRSLLAECGLFNGGEAPSPDSLKSDSYPELLSVAAGHVSVELFTRLLDARRDVPITVTVNGRTLLHEAAVNRHTANTNLLLERGLDPNATDDAGRTPLHLVVSNADGANLVRLLLSRGARAADRDNKGVTPLMLASSACMKVLALKGVNLAEQDSQGNTALHWAVTRRSIEQARTLIELGAPLDIQDVIGQTPLHRAIMKVQEKMAQMLIKAGANADIADMNGTTARQAADQGGVAMRGLFLREGENAPAGTAKESKP